MKLFIALLLMLSPFACADYVYLGAWSHHWEGQPDKTKKDYNQTHNLIAYERKGYMVGHFTNSFNESTFIATKNFELEKGDFSFFFAAGATHGYTNCENQKKDAGTDKKICPYYQGGVAYTKFKIQPAIAFNQTVALLTFRIKI